MQASRNAAIAGVLVMTGIFLTVTACATLIQPTRVPSLVPPTVPAPPTSTTTPLYEQVTLQTTPWQETGTPFDYTIQADVPMLAGSSDPRVQNFNVEMRAVVDDAVAMFKQNLAGLTPTPNSTVSTFELHYSVVSPPGDLISVMFTIQTYYSGAAHPADASRTVTYDLEAGKDLSMTDLFLPNSDYLTQIAKYCSAQLSTRDIGFQGFELGATATPENYRNWNVTADGLLITFDEYQVAPYAAGPQAVVLPYSELASLIDPHGPLAQYAGK
jgi:hypothetical protein